MARPTVFISHISSETELAQILKKHLTDDFLNYFDVFVSSDGKTITAGSPWLTELRQALEGAQIEIILCSKGSVGRPWVNFEAGAGWVRGIQVIPLCHSGMEPYELPVPLSMLQAVKADQADSLRALYGAIAATYGMQVPPVDFEAIAREIRALEEKYRQAGQGLERIKNPRVLCAASEEYAQIGFHLDVAVLSRVFPEVEVEYNLTAKLLRERLTSQRFDIVHLVTAVDYENGDLVFSPTFPDTHKPATPKVDKMSAEGFATFIAESQTRLVVLATCNALALAVEVAGVANMIATNRDITGEAAAEWEEIFYDLLAKGRSLYKSYELTKANNGTPMRLIRLKDVAFDLAP